MRQIAGRAGIALGGIYNHFAAKEDIFLAVFTTYHPYRAILSSLAEVDGEALPDVLHYAAHRMVTILRGRPDFLNLVFIEVVEFKGQHIPLVFPTVYPELFAFAESLASQHAELRAIPLSTLIRAFLGITYSYMMTEMLFNTISTPGEANHFLDEFVDILLYGILREPPSVQGGAK
jgi:AcrR family transcriptional regulator